MFRICGERIKPLSLRRRKGREREGKFALFSLSLPSLFSARHAGYRPLMAIEFLPFFSQGRGFQLTSYLIW